MYVKGFEPDLTGRGGFQFEVGKTYVEPGGDDWVWFHYANRITECLGYYHDKNARFCEVTPLGKKKLFKCNGHRYWTTNKIRIDRKLPHDEVLERLKAERCPLWLLLEFKAPIELLAPAVGKRPSISTVIRVLQHEGLTPEERKSILPKKYHAIVENIADATRNSPMPIS